MSIASWVSARGLSSATQWACPRSVLVAAVQVPWHSVGTMLRLERHPFGPRVYVLHRRIHEYHLGLAVLAALAVGAFFDVVDLGLATALAAVAGVWLVAKDWRDLVPSQRGSAPLPPGL